MRFVWAVAAFVLATIMIGAGIAQRTVWLGAESVTEKVAVDSAGDLVLVDGAVLNAHPGSQTFTAAGSGDILAVYGRTDDMRTWLSRADYTEVSATETAEGSTDDQSLTTAAVPASDPQDEDAAPLNPTGSDLWLDEVTQTDTLTTRLQLPEDMSVLLYTGEDAGPITSVSVTWPTGVTTPWAGPLIVGGGIFLLAGIILYLLGLRRVRRSRGPRRKGLPMPVTEPIDLAVVEEEKGVISATPTRRQLSSGKRRLIAVPAVVLAGALVTGCSADSWPQFEATATPTPTDTIVVPEGQDAPPVVTKTQAERILSRVAERVAAADEKLSVKAAGERLEGAALALRETNYTLRKDLKDYAAPTPIPTDDLELLLPEATEGWPRTFLAVVEEPENSVATVMTFSQADAWSDYKLAYSANLGAEATLNVAPDYLGALQVPPDSPFLVLPPQDLAAAYADVVDKGDDSEFASLFEETGDSFRTQVADSRADNLEDFNKTGEETGKLAFKTEPGDDPLYAVATLDSGAIVAVTLNELVTVTPTNDEAVIKLDGDPANPTVEALTGVSQSATGFTTVYGDQLFFFVPAQSSTERIQFLGYSSDILSAKVVK